MTRKLTSIVLALCMVFSCFAICGTVASAATPAQGNTNSRQYAQDEIQGSAVLHCFNWTYKNIENNLADIAAAGYTAVQTSPVQQHKDYYPGTRVLGDEWWKLYQPVSINIAPAGTSYLGSPTDLSDLCEAADDYGIKIIVDIVANHLANDGTYGGGFARLSPEVEAVMHNANYYHTDTTYINDQSRYNMTQYHMGMPDLKTQDVYIQERYLQLLKDCVDLGVDGFRFDAAKHIELPTDPSNIRGNFWPYVINGIKQYDPDVYVYGEILGSAGTAITNYTTYMSVTDDVTSRTAREGAYYNNAEDLAASATYNKGAGAGKSVLWVESHDNYMNDGSGSIDSADIARAWAITGARADSMALYLARPNAIMSAVSTDTTWKSTEVAEVNKFKNFFDGTTEKISYSGRTAYIERGTSGVVISKLDGAGAVNLTASKMASGNYVDQITNNVFTVSNGRIQGTVGESGIAVVYNPDGVSPTVPPTTAPATTISGTTAPDGNITVYFTDALNWKSCNVYYWGTDADPSWPGVAMSDYEVNGYGQQVYSARIPADATGVIFNGSGKQTVDITTGIADGAWWYTNGDSVDGKYDVTLVNPPEPETTVAPTTARATTVPATTVKATTVPATTVPATTVPASTITVYFTDALSWGGTPNVHYWGGTSGDTKWPGNAMTLYETNTYGQKVYKATVPGDVTGVIFNSNGKQTVDITTGIADGAWWYTNGEMEDNNYKVTLITPPDPVETTAAPDVTTVAPTTVKTETTAAPTGTITVYFTDALHWGDAKVYYWGSNADPQWPGNAMSVYQENNDFGQTVYVATIPANVSGVIFYGDGKQTVDITTGIEDGAWWYTNGESEDGKFKVTKIDKPLEETTVAPDVTTVAPTTVNTETTAAPTGTIKVYFTDALGWGTANVYCWGTEGAPTWPGTAMTVYQDDNGYGQKVYTATVPADVTGIIFNGGNKQTVDITTGIENGAQWYTIDEKDGNNYKVNKVDDLIIETTVKPTAEPTTVAPTTVAPTTVAPTTVAPTTAQPTTEPVIPTEGVTIKVVVPNIINSAYAWNDARLYYNNTGKSADNRYINMVENNVFYMTEPGSGIADIVNTGGWKVFTVTLTAEQTEAVNNALWVGFANGNGRCKTVSEKAKNILKAGAGTFDTGYNNAKASVASFDGYTFIIKDNNSATSPYSSFIGYWTSDFTTVMMAAPMSDNSYSNWNAVSLSYGATGDSETAIPMVNTGSTTKVSDIGDMSTLRAGRWYIYAVTLDAAQTADVNAATRVGFVKPGGNNRTAGSKNVLKAKTNAFDGNYNSTARTLEELEGQVFVVKAKASASSIVIYNGEWQTENVYTAGNNDTVEIFFAAPKGAANTTAGWDTGVELYYGTTTAYQNCARLEMTPVNGVRNVSINGTGLTTLSSGNWDLYSITMDAEMISTIDAATTVGFIKKGTYNRTSALYTKNIAKAPTTEDGTYTKNKQSIETFDGKTFVINNCADSKNERTSYMGIWCN